MNPIEAFCAAMALAAEAERRYELAVDNLVRARNAALEAQADYFRVVDLAGECAARIAEADGEQDNEPAPYDPAAWNAKHAREDAA